MIRSKKLNRERIAQLAMTESAGLWARLTWVESPERQAEAEELTHVLADAISRTGENYRVVLTLRLIEDYSPAEIAELLALKGSTVRMRLKRGLKKLHKLLRARGLDVDLQ
jgi:RNA polymerase sigma factor (sigma-70 family)